MIHKRAAKRRQMERNQTEKDKAHEQETGTGKETQKLAMLESQNTQAN